MVQNAAASVLSDYKERAYFSYTFFPISVKLGLNLSFLTMLIVRGGSGDPESSLSYTAIGLLSVSSLVTFLTYYMVLAHNSACSQRLLLTSGSLPQCDLSCHPPIIPKWSQ